MSDILGKVKDERNLLEKVASYIPGYHGYKEKELRRESDRLVRQQAADKLKRASDNLKRSLSSGLKLPDAKRLVADQVIARLDLLKERIRKTEGGYAGFFDVVKVREDRLDKMMSADLNIIDISSLLADKIKQASSKSVFGPAWDQEMSEVVAQMEKLDDVLQRRDDILSMV